MIETVPKGWSLSGFSDLLDIRDERHVNDGEYPLYSLTIADGVTPKSDRYNREFLVVDKEKKKYKIIYPNDIVYNPSNLRWGALARSKVPYKVLASPIYEVMSSKGDEFVHPVFLEYLAKSDQLFAKYVQFAEGTLVERTALKLEVFMSLKFPLPPLPEQKKIAAILSSVDDVIEKTRAQIDKLKDLKTGMMQELLTKGIGHTEFKDSPVGRIPVDWSVASLNDLCSIIRDGTHLPPKRVPTGIPLLSVRNMQNGKFALLDDDTYVTREFYEKMHAKWKPEGGDLLLAVVGATVGKVCQVPNNFPEFTLQRSVAVLRGKTGALDNNFLYAYSQSKPFNDSLWDRVNQTAQPGIYLAEIGKIIAPVPSLKEQHAIAIKLRSVDEVINRFTQKVRTIGNLKKALMQDLLTGKVRVNVDNKESAAA